MSETEKKVFKYKWEKPRKLKLMDFIDPGELEDKNDTKLIPIPLNAVNSKMPPLWGLTTNFRITTYLLREIEKVDGVEILVANSPYNMRIGIGELFDVDEVRINIQKTLKEAVKN